MPPIEVRDVRAVRRPHGPRAVVVQQPRPALGKVEDRDPEAALRPSPISEGIAYKRPREPGGVEESLAEGAEYPA